MGQYYKVALVDNEGKVKVIRPDGWKLMEHSYYGNRSMNRIQKLLYRNAMNVIWVGDYSKIFSLVWKHEFEDVEEINYDTALPPTSYLNMTSGENIDKYFYLVNKSAKEFINMTKQMMDKELESNWGSIIHPLPLLCRAETEEAGGDYHSEKGQEHIGQWCGDLITIYSYDTPLESELELDGYTDMTNIYWFKE